MAALNRFGGRLFGTVEAARGCQTIIQQGKPFYRSGSYRVIDKRANALRSELNHIFDFQQGKAAETHGRLIGQRVALPPMLFEGPFESGKRFLINTEQEFFSRRRGQDFVEKNLEVRI